jgi:hypothetical protein
MQERQGVRSRAARRSTSSIPVAIGVASCGSQIPAERESEDDRFAGGNLALPGALG